jgi:hypothetical protein
MSETQTQAVLRLLRLLATAVISFLAVQLPGLINLFVLDPAWQAVAALALTAILDSASKLIGGPTEPMETQKLMAGGKKEASANRPSFLSI